MNKEQLKDKLLKEKSVLEESLNNVANKDKEVQGNWEAKYPITQERDLEDAQDEVEEYGTNLELEHTLEKRLLLVNEALDRIGKGEYGKCQKCGMDIAEERLEADPAARTCEHCTE